MKENFIIRIYNTQEEDSIDIDKPKIKLVVEEVPDSLDDLLKEHGGDWATVHKIQH